MYSVFHFSTEKLWHMVLYHYNLRLQSNYPRVFGLFITLYALGNVLELHTS